jgi:hypothetical protein
MDLEKIVFTGYTELMGGLNRRKSDKQRKTRVLKLSVSVRLTDILLHDKRGRVAPTISQIGAPGHNRRLLFHGPFAI